MRFKSRYKFWQVLVGFISIGVLAAIIYFSTGGEMPPSHNSTGPNANPHSGLRSLYDFFYYVTMFYICLNYYYALVAANKGILSYLKVTVLIIVIVLVYQTIIYYCFPLMLHNKHRSALALYLAVMPSLLPIVLISFLFANLTYLWESKKQRRILEAQKLQLETQISQANFNFLKSQINPHFLHNTLNFLYAKSLPYSAELSEGILTLSDIMRYALGQGNQKDGKALLSDEIEHVKNVIKISQLRYSNALNVNLEVTGDINGALIIPFVLITLVENAFKHGDLKSPEYPIDIQLRVKGQRLYFYCRNKKKTGPKQLSTGIGLENIKKRLYLAYGDQYTFEIHDDTGFYTTELTIDKL
jgi:two-component system, LytTR family, sensor kinase